MSKRPSLNLPTLLSSLPNLASSSSSRSTPILVRPAQWPADSFYTVTRTKLKYRAGAAGASAEQGQAQALEGQVASVKAGGKAWGQLFWKGRFGVYDATTLRRYHLAHTNIPIDPG
jgi:hypothetical protein